MDDRCGTEPLAPLQGAVIVWADQGVGLFTLRSPDKIGTEDGRPRSQNNIRAARRGGLLGWALSALWAGKMVGGGPGPQQMSRHLPGTK
jgi:hypothetical protein